MKRLFLDVEVYRNYFLALFMDERGKAQGFEIFDGDDSAFQRDVVFGLITHKDVEIVTFNGNSYDLPILTLALTAPCTKTIKAASDRIIEQGIKPWQFYKSEGLREPLVNHIDLIEVAPGQVGLKIYGGRLNSPKLQDLPIEPSSVISKEHVPLLRKYCRNDLQVTQMLYNSLGEQIELRREMSRAYGVDLRSKSDAQIAEAVLKAEFERRTGDVPTKTRLAREIFRYVAPSYIRFLTPTLQSVLDVVSSADMVVDSKTGHVKMPKTIERLKIEIGQTCYKIGIGGLHSQESEVCYFTDSENVLIDRDVESYYPRMMLNMNMRPGGFGEHFNPIYEGILEERLSAKHRGDAVKSASLKIVLNGTFGKTSSKYSTLYSPEFMIRTTLTGQLTILMLIEALEHCNIPVVSANTDGVVIKCPREKLPVMETLIARWEKHTGLKTEETRYKALYSRDVNNYIAVKENGKAKAKGVYGPVTLTKNPQNPICSEAVIEHLTTGKPIEDIVKSCKDITKFLTLRTVTGGAIKDGEVLGKAIRWYYARGEAGVIAYRTNGNTVARSEGARPLMDLPDEFPRDVDHSWYIRECEEILMDLGVKPRPFVEKIPRKNSNAWKELRDAGKIKESSKGKWEWVK